MVPGCSKCTENPWASGYFLALPFALALLPLALSSAFDLSSLRLSSLLPGAPATDFGAVVVVVVVEEPITTTPIVDDVTAPPTAGAFVVVLVVLVLVFLCLPQSLFAASLRRFPFGCDETHAPWFKAFSHVIGRICTGLGVVVVVVVVVVGVVVVVVGAVEVVDVVWAGALAARPNKETAATLVTAKKRVAFFIAFFIVTP